MTILSIDLGSTGGKFVTESGLTGLVPAVTGTACDIWQWEPDYIQIEHGGKQLFVGRSAMEQAENPIFALQNNKMERSTVEQVLHAVLAYVAHNAGDTVFDVVATLPFDATSAQKESLVKLLDQVSGRRIAARIGGERIAPTITIRRKHLIPEGYAGWCNYVLDDDGGIVRKELARQRVFVGDLGLFHFSELVIDKMVPQGRPISRSTSLGLSLAHLAASRALGGIDVWRVDQGARSGEYDVSGAFEGYAQRVNQEVVNFEARQGAKFQFYYWTGGGCHAIGKWLAKGKMAMAEDGQMDNALGGCKVGKRLLASGKWQ